MKDEGDENNEHKHRSCGNGHRRGRLCYQWKIQAFETQEKFVQQLPLEQSEPELETLVELAIDAEELELA